MQEGIISHSCCAQYEFWEFWNEVLVGKIVLSGNAAARALTSGVGSGTELGFESSWSRSGFFGGFGG